jgi:phage terminase large subunit-like protein
MPWQVWLYLAGRGSGKTRSGAEWCRYQVYKGCRHGGLISPTTQDIRKVMIEGVAGILACSYEDDVDINGNLMGVPEYSPSLGHRLTWANGAQAHCFSAEEPDRLRGPQHDFLWCDELAAWHYAQDTWDMAMFGLRLGVNPQVMISTTPRPIPIIRELMKSKYTILTKSSTLANRANLSEIAVQRWLAKYAGTRIGRQELNAELLEEMEGALWNRETIEACFLGSRQLPHLVRIVVAIDPAITQNPTSNLTGIIVAALGADGLGYVLEDSTARYSPDGWGKEAVRLFDLHHADRIVAEGNQGGDMVRHTLETVRKNVPISIVHASRSKQARAEPVAALYEQGRVFHVKHFIELEDQMCTWEPLSPDPSIPPAPSPDRLDAMVWALTNLMLDAQIIPFTLPIVGSAGPRTIPGQ